MHADKRETIFHTIGGDSTMCNPPPGPLSALSLLNQVPGVWILLLLVTAGFLFAFWRLRRSSISATGRSSATRWFLGGSALFYLFAILNLLITPLWQREFLRWDGLPLTPSCSLSELTMMQEQTSILILILQIIGALCITGAGLCLGKAGRQWWNSRVQHEGR